MLNYEEIKGKIKEKGLSDDEIEARVSLKVKQLNDLVSKEGAAHILANELGIKLVEEIAKRRLKIKDILAGMSSVSILGKVTRMNDVFEYKTEKRQGRLIRFSIGDETGIIRCVIWDEPLIKQIEKGGAKEGDIVKIRNAYSRDNNGFVELHLGNKSQIIVNPENEKVEVREKGPILNYETKRIKDLKENENVAIRGAVLQIFEPKFFRACPECNKKVILKDDKEICEAHGSVAVKDVPILNLFLDDGTENIRIVLFRDLAERFSGKNTNELKNLSADDFESLKKSLLGEEFSFDGRVVKNLMFERLEFIARNFRKIDIDVYLNELSGEVMKDVS